MTRVVGWMREYKEILILLATIGALASPLGRRMAEAQPSPADRTLEARVDSVARTLNILVKLACLNERQRWEELDLSGISCVQLIQQH